MTDYWNRNSVTTNYTTRPWIINYITWDDDYSSITNYNNRSSVTTTYTTRSIIS
jgi:hypothetical protein